MVKFILVQFIVFILSFSLWAKSDRVFSEGYLGEKRLDSYSDRYSPLIFQDIYRGKMSFEDEIFFQNFFQRYLFTPEKDFSFFLGSELNSGLTCTNELLSEHFDEIRYAYRLITLSYLLEGQWHLKLASDHFKMKKGCGFDLKEWVKTCHPQSIGMKKFVERLKKHSPKYEEELPREYSKNSWWREFSKNDFKLYSHYRLKTNCKGICPEEELESKFKNVCEEDQKIMTQICSEVDEIYGLSQQRDAYFLIGRSNIINTFNKNGEAMGCLRRFSEVMSHKEVRYDVLTQLFPSLQSFLAKKYQERFLQGRVFFFGAGKEFEEKGLQNLYVMDQPLKVESLPTEEPLPQTTTKIETPSKKVEPVKPVVSKAPEAPLKKDVVELKAPVKSAFLQAAEVRSSSNLDRVEVDMTKLKYDYVFSLNMINTLSEKLAVFMTRDALAEMSEYDKLGTKEGPVPLLFIKYMIDMQEHHGLYNLVSVLGDKFYVSNEIDPSFKPAPERIQLLNNESTGRQWQIYILKP